jgi:cation diffusion facilitator CzcD-associated flavoprotein CzcO
MSAGAGEILDVAIVGAGLSGIGTACHLLERRPGTSFALLEARAALGGTWDLFRFPGVRSDSDMFTLGYGFRPWKGREAIADGASILAYLRETARERGVEPHIRLGQRLRRASWSSADALWTLELEGGARPVRCRFLSMCSGYYRYDRGHAPEFEGAGRFRGRIVHPQHWPEDLDWTDRRVAVIGSGATAITLVPALARDAAHVTMVQRSPSWILSLPGVDALANRLRRFLPEALVYRIVRWRNARLQLWLYRQARSRPARIRSLLLREVRRQLGPDFDVATHFTPRYEPWDQRLCVIPDGDLFRAIREGRASVATGQVARFTESGLELESGERIDADVVVTATGLELELLGGAEFLVDGARVAFGETFTYKGLMFSGVPNLVQTFGYINASWTLRADLTAEWTCRLLDELERRGARSVTPRLRSQDREMSARPWVDGFTPNYLQRALHRFPRQGDRAPWLNPQDYDRDRALLRRAPLADDVLAFER